MFYNYLCRLAVRACVFAAAVYAYIANRAVFAAFFFGEPAAAKTTAYIIWAFMAVEMILGIVPAGINTTGSEKHRKSYFAPSDEGYDAGALGKYAAESNIKAAYVAGVWLVIFAAVAALHISGTTGVAETALICILFYVCDIICVVFWCPFRSIMMKNRCCVTCRVYNWDWFMLCSPLILIKSFFSLSLVALSLVLLVKWEVTYKKHPEYFWEGSNKNLRCENCAERICGAKNNGITL
ncbi:MAG: hypothetical protein FWG32_07040 [Oscillospiraceae bacterium]|nr:hypothetical protein [Oscillospiraceae bacterium]